MKLAAPTRPDYALRLLAFFPACVLLPIYAAHAVQTNGNDFGTFYRAACVGPLYGYDPLAPTRGAIPGEISFRNLNPPHFHLLIWPLCGLSVSIAYGVWMLASTAGLGLGLWLARRVPTTKAPWFALPIALVTSPLVFMFAMGQVTGVLAPAVTLAWWEDRRHRPFRAGCWLGLAAAIKPFLGLFGPWWLARREWPAAIGATVSGLTSIAAGILFFGLSNLAAWTRELTAITWIDIPYNVSVWGFWNRWHAPDWLAWASAASVAVLTGRRLRTAPVDIGWALVLAAALLISPVAWVYYAIWLAPMLLVVQLPAWVWCVVVPAWTIPLVPTGSLPTATSVMPNIYFYGMLAMWMGLLVGHQRSAAERVRYNP